MIIHQPEILVQNGRAMVWAKVELEKKRDNFPDFIWYRVHEDYTYNLSVQSDAFLVSALLAGMYFGEDIQVRGTVSPRLAYSLGEFQALLHFRMPEVVRPVAIQFEHIAPITENLGAVGSTFSGGIDSLFTIWKHLPQNQPLLDYQVSHAVFIRGFDILHTENENYHQLYKQFQAQLSQYKIKLIELETNMVSITHMRMNLSYLYGPLIISTALSLQGLFKRFFIPSSWDYKSLSKKAHGSDPLIDGFLSTDTLEIINHGSTNKRIEKVEQIANWELAQKTLWVCLETKFKEKTWNCSRCEKCMRTMIPIFALGKMPQFQTFEIPLKKNIDVLWWARKFSLRHKFFYEIFPFVKEHKSDLLPWLYIAATFGFIRNGIVNYMPGGIKRWLRKYGYYVTRNEAPDAYEIKEITQRLKETYDHPST